MNQTPTPPPASDEADSQPGWLVLDEFSLPSEAGNERPAMERVARAVSGLDLSKAQGDRLRTAVAETAMNAIEHGNRFQADLPFEVSVRTRPGRLSVRVTDQSGDRPIPEQVQPDIEAKLAGLQSARGWGLFLIQNMVDEMHVHSDAHHHTVELVFHLPEAAP